MPQLNMGFGASGRQTIGLPWLRQVNCFSEPTKEGPTNAARIGRPGLTPLYDLSHVDTASPGPILRLFQNPGLFRGDLFTVSADSLYRNTVFLGNVPYGLQPRMAASLTQLAIVTGGALYVYDGTTLTLVQYFDDGSSRLPSFSSVAVLYNIFVFTVAGSNQFYFSNVGDAATINAANFSSVETSPDPVVEVQVLAEELYFFGSKTVEIWDFTGSLTAPFALSQGRTYARGCAAQGSVAYTDNALFWVGDNFTLYRTSTTPVRVSTPYIEDRLRNAGANLDRMTAFNLAIEGHDFYIFNLPSTNESYAYDCQTQEWAQWGSHQNFDTDVGVLMVSCSTGQGETLYAGSRTDSRIWLWDNTANLDDGSPIRKMVSCSFWTTAGKLRLNNIGLACVRGVGNEPFNPDPQVQMRMSKDTRTFGPWLSASLGGAGDYSRKAVWRALGLVSQPGLIVEFTTTENVIFAAEGASYNSARF